MQQLLQLHMPGSLLLADSSRPYILQAAALDLILTYNALRSKDAWRAAGYGGRQSPKLSGLQTMRHT